jgi:integrase
MLKFTQSSVRALRPPACKADYFVQDDSLAGFGVRFRGGGAGVYAIRYSLAGQDRRLSYQRVDRVTLADARTWARRQFAAVGERTDPAAARARAVAKIANTIEPLIEPFLAHLAGNGRSTSYLAENTRSLRRYFSALHRFAATDITRAMVSRELASIRTEHGPIAADRSRSHLSSFFAWSIGEGAAENNPCIGTNRTGGKARSRTLNDAELRSIWKALDVDDYSTIIKLLILTGARRAEIGSLSRSEINLLDKQIELPGARTKNGLDFIIPMSPRVLALVKNRKRHGSDFVFGRGRGGFAGWSTAKRALDGRLQIEPWTVHDFRRCMSTRMHEVLKIPPHVVEACLNHKRGGIAAVYNPHNRMKYRDEKREALGAYADHVAKIVGRQ